MKSSDNNFFKIAIGHNTKLAEIDFLGFNQNSWLGFIVYQLL